TMKLSCPEQMLADYTPTDRLRIIRGAGFDGVDCRHTSLEDAAFLAALSESGLPLGSVYSQVRNPSLLDAAAQDRAGAVDEIVGRARAAAAHGADNLILVPVFGATRRTLDLPDEEISAIELAILVASLKEIGARLADVPVTVVIEPLNRKETHLL